MTKRAKSRRSDITAAPVQAEDGRPGDASARQVKVAIESGQPDDWITRARRSARPKVIAEGWSDTDLDRIIDDERNAVQPDQG